MGTGANCLLVEEQVEVMEMVLEVALGNQAGLNQIKIVTV